MEKTKAKCYVLKTNPSKTLKIKVLIERNPELKGKISQVYAPTEKVISIKKNGEKTFQEKPCYSGYIMLETNLVAQITHSIKSIPGVSGFLCSKDGLPIALPKSEVEKLLNKSDEFNNKSSYTPFLVGENVKITNKGAFDSFCGSIIEVNKEIGKLKLEVMIFGRPTSLELNFNEVEKI